jgi:hypothetical protein
MDVISFLYVSLGSRTIEFHDSYVVDAHAHIQKLVSVVKMVTVLDKYTTEEQRSVVLLL